MRTLFFFLLISIAISGQAQKANLALNLEKGKEYRQNMTMKSAVNQDLEGQKINMELSSKASMTYLVKDIDERGYIFDVKFDSIIMSMNTPYGVFEFSSEKNEPSNVFSAMLAAMKNKSFEITMAKTGKVIEIKNVDDLFDAAISELDLMQISEEQKEQTKAQVMKAYGADAFRGNTEMVTAIFPENPVNIWDRWVVNTKLESGMSGKITTDYELSDQTSGYYIIKGKSTIVTEDKDAYIESNGMPMKFDIKGSMESEIKVDKKTGWIIEAKTNQELSGDAYIKENPQVPNGMKVPISMRTIATVAN
ncbi:MAG: DUF6263 family protein [Dysgonomonas sp.]